MNDFLNGIFKIWEKLPDEGKSAFTENLTIKEKSAVKIGKQLLEYYVDVSQDLKRREEERRLREEELARQRKGKKGKKGSHEAPSSSSQADNEANASPLEALLKNLPPELVQSVMQNIAASMKHHQSASPQVNAAPPSKQPEEDIIDAEWTEITNDGKRVTRK